MFKLTKNINKKAAILLLVFITSMALSLVFVLVRSSMHEKISEQSAAERWSSSPYTLVSCYFHEGEGITTQQRSYIESQFETELTNNSIDISSLLKRVWLHSASTEDEITVQKGKNSVEAVATLIDGDFFVFHQPTLLYGSYLSDATSHENFVVIEDTLAWRLFGAVNVVGMEIEISGCVYYVTGVVEHATDKVSQRIIGENPRIYMYATSECFYGRETTFSSYEVLLPCAIKGAAYDMAEKVFNAFSDDCVIIDQTNRFSFTNIIKKIPELKYLGVKDDTIKYPYWENMSIVTETKSAVLLIFELIFISAASCSGLIIVVWIYRKIKKAVASQFMKMKRWYRRKSRWSAYEPEKEL